MKKIKNYHNIIKALLALVVVAISCLGLYCCSDHKRTIRTEYGDVFIGHSDKLSDAASLSCLEHNFCISVLYFGSETDLSPICDTKYFRCYKFSNIKENMFICGLKPNGDYFWIDPYEKNPPKFFKEQYSEDFLKVFLADKYIMQVTMNYMDGVYHDELMDMAQKLTSGNYEGLEKYGLTEEMINDKESLDEKIGIMEEYLKANKEQTSTSSTIH